MAGVACSWAALNEELEGFFAAVEAHAAAPERWCTPAHIRAVRAVLDHGAGLLAHEPPLTESLRAVRLRYAANLLRLLEVMQSLQRSLTVFAERLEGSRQHLGAVHAWLDRHL